MRILLYHLNRHKDDNGKRRYRKDDTVKTAFEKALEIADDDSDDDVFPISSKRSQIQRLFDSDDDVDAVENNIILIEPPKHKDQDSNEKRLEVESHMKRLFDPEHYNSDTVRIALPKSKDCDTSTNSNKQDGIEKSLGIVDANSDHNSKKSQARSIFDSNDDDDDNTAKDKTSKTVSNSKEDQQDLSATYVLINSSAKSPTNNRKSQAKRLFDSENNSNEPPHKKSKDQVKNRKERLEKNDSKEKPNSSKHETSSKNETSNPTNESGKIIHIFGASFLQQYKCDQCYQTFDDCFKLKRHSMVAHKTKPSEAAPKSDHACHICSKKFSDRNMLWGHMRVHSLRDKYSCKLCKFEASSVRELIDHQSVCKGKKQTSNKAEEKTNNLEKKSTEDVIALEMNNEKADSNNEKKTSNISSNKRDIAEKSAITKEKSVSKTNKSQSLSNVVKKRINSDSNKDRKTSSNNIDDAIQKPNDIEEISDSSKKNTNNTLNDTEKDNAEISTGNSNLTNTTSNTADKIEKQTSTALKYRCSICKKKFAEINEMRMHKTLHCSQQTPFEKKSAGLRTTLLVDMVVTTDNSNRTNVTSVTIAIANNMSDVTTVTSSNLSRVTCCSSSPDKIKSSPTKSSDDLKLIEMKPKFKCCGKIFSKRIDLFLHMKEESGTSSEVIDCDPVYICDICLETFYERLAWYQHSKIKHKNYYEQRSSKSSVVMRKPRYACGACYMKFDLLIKLKEHKSACSNSELNKKRAELNISDLKNQFEEFYQSKTVTEIDQNQNDGEKSDDSSIIIDPDSDTDNIVETNVETDSHDPDINVEMDVKVERQENETYRCDICYDEFTQHSELMEHEAFHREIAPPPPAPPLDMPDLLDTNRSNQIPQQDQNKKRISITIPPLKHQVPSINPKLIITNNIETDTSSTTSNVNNLDCSTNSSTDVLLSTQNIGLAQDCINKEVDQNNLDCSVSGNSTFPNNPDIGVTQDCVNSTSSNSTINPNSNLAQDKPIEDMFAECEDLFNPQQDKNTSPTTSNDFEDRLVIDEQPPDNTQIGTEVPQPSAPRIFVKNIRDLMNPDVLPNAAENEKQNAIKTPQKQGKSILRCDECNQSFTRTRTFRKHQRVTKFKYCCSFCNFCTCSSNKRKVHYRTQHKDAYVTYCCGKEFLSAADLSAHQLHHNKCPTCNCSFRNLSKHKTHCQRPSITVTEVIQNMQATRQEEIIPSGQSTDVNLVIPPVSSNNTQEGTNSFVPNYQLVWQGRM